VLHNLQESVVNEMKIKDEKLSEVNSRREDGGEKTERITNPGLASGAMLPRVPWAEQATDALNEYLAKNLRSLRDK
jgi:hypothetical protein